MDRSNAAARLPDELEFPPFTTFQSSLAKSTARLLRAGTIVSDETFDEVFPPAVKHASLVHWTPVDVAVRAARLLAPERSARVLDIGAGVGKFCLVAAAVTGADVCGVERRPYLVSVAREAARRMGVAVDVREGSFGAEHPAGFDGFYLFNPFTESLRVPGAVEPGPYDPQSIRADVKRAYDFLGRARDGAQVVTFCGFGGAMPGSYQHVLREDIGGGILELWKKTRAL